MNNNNYYACVLIAIVDLLYRNFQTLLCDLHLRNIPSYEHYNIVYYIYSYEW